MREVVREILSCRAAVWGRQKGNKENAYGTFCMTNL